MRWYLLVAAVTVTAATLTGSAPVRSASARAAAPGLRATAGTQLWVARFRANDLSLSDAMAVSPDGSRVFVTGESRGSRRTGAAQTVAYSAATGRLLWASRYRGAGNGSAPAAVAVSPGGRKVFVTGVASGWGTGPDYATVAYNAATGRQLWARHYHGPGIGTGNDADSASAMAVSPGGAMVFVTGTSTGRRTGQSDYATVAYTAATGRRLWVRRYNGPANGLDGATAVAVSPAGATVFVTGTSDGRTPGQYATIAYGAATGRQLWVSRYNGPGNGFDGASAAAVSPGGATVFVTGYSGGRSTNDYATVAYRAGTGTQLWVSRYHGYEAESAAVSPDRATVYVTGYNGLGGDYATVAYRAATGRQLWVSRYHGPANNGGACCVAVSPAGRTVFVTGWSQGRTGYAYATVAYRS